MTHRIFSSEEVGVSDRRFRVEGQHASVEIFQEMARAAASRAWRRRPSGMIAIPDRISAWHMEAVNRRRAG